MRGVKLRVVKQITQNIRIMIPLLQVMKKIMWVEGGQCFPFLTLNFKCQSLSLLLVRFGSPKELKLCLTMYSVSNGYPIQFDMNDKHRLLAFCEKGFPWR